MKEQLGKVRIGSIAGALLMVLGVFQIFAENDVWYHDALQVSYVIGMMVFFFPHEESKSQTRLFRLFTAGLVLTVLGSIYTLVPVPAYWLSTLCKTLFITGIALYFTGIIWKYRKRQAVCQGAAPSGRH